MPGQIKYNGKVLATMKDGTTVELNTTKKELQGNLEIAVESGGITPTGTLDITANGSYDVTEKAQVNVAVPLPPKWDKTVVFEALKSGYTVTVLLYTSMGWSEGANFEYSTDGGTAWTPVSLQYDTPFVIDVEEGGQFRYRVSPVNGVLWVDEGDAVIHSGYGTYTSPNKTLTANLEINIDTGD